MLCNAGSEYEKFEGIGSGVGGTGSGTVGGGTTGSGTVGGVTTGSGALVTGAAPPPQADKVKLITSPKAEHNCFITNCPT